MRFPAARDIIKPETDLPTMKKKTARTTSPAAAEAEMEPTEESAEIEPIDWKEVCASAETFVREHPAAAVVIAASVGFVVGRMFR